MQKSEWDKLKKFKRSKVNQFCQNPNFFFKEYLGQSSVSIKKVIIEKKFAFWKKREKKGSGQMIMSFEKNLEIFIKNSIYILRWL